MSVTTSVVAHGGSSNAHTATYEVTASNESATYTWFNADFSESYPYTVENDSEITVDIFDLTNPHSELNVTIGNLSRTHILDSEANSNLAIGYWKMNETFGFISETDWEGVETNFSKMPFNSSSFDSDAEYTFGATTFDAVRVSFEDSFQSTTLVYNKGTGVLYHANVTTGNFVLTFDITGLVPHGDDDSETQNSPVGSLAVFLSLASLAIIVRLKKSF